MNGKQRHCKNCQKLYYLSSSQRENKEFCCFECEAKYYNIILICRVCNKEFIPTTANQVYCNNDCKKKFYKNYHLEFKKISNFKIFARDNFKCVYCGTSSLTGENLRIDHIYPRNLDGKNHVFNLVTSCEKCNSCKQDILLSEEQILNLWERNKKLDEKSGLIKEYEELKKIFDKKYK